MEIHQEKANDMDKLRTKIRSKEFHSGKTRIQDQVKGLQIQRPKHTNTK